MNLLGPLFSRSSSPGLRAGAAVAVAATAVIATAFLPGQTERAASSDVDEATRAFVERLRSEPRNAALSRRYGDILERLASGGADGEAALRALRRFTVLFVPGFAWASDPSTGADFARQRALLARHGVENALLEIEEDGRVVDNARQITQRLRDWGTRRPRLVVVSASKGSAEAALALGSLLSPEEVAPIAGWVSVGGLLRGSPYVDRALSGPRRWMGRLVFGFKGLSFDAVTDLSTAARREAMARLALPEHAVKVALVGAPLSSTIGREARGRFETLAAYGPNDGLTLLEDELIPGGLALVETGLDHYFRDPRIDLKTLALAAVVAEMALDAGPPAMEE